MRCPVAAAAAFGDGTGALVMRPTKTLDDISSKLTVPGGRARTFVAISLPYRASISNSTFRPILGGRVLSLYSVK